MGKRQIIYIPVPVNLKTEPAPEAPSEVEGQEIELAMDASELAALFALKGWMNAVAGGEAHIPDGLEILTSLYNLARAVADDESAASATSGRFLAVQDPSFPTDIDLYLYVGRVDNTTLNADEADGTLDDLFH